MALTFETVRPEDSRLDPLRTLDRRLVWPDASKCSLLYCAAFDGPTIVGCGGIRFQGKRRATSKTLIVSPEYRGQGVGSMLLAFSLKLAAGRDIDANVTPDSLSIYLKAGFIIRHRYANGITRVERRAAT